MRRALRVLLLLLALPSCSGPPQTPEQVLRGTISRATRAAEDREWGELSEIVSGRYRDAQGYDREGVLGLARRVLIAYGSVYVVTRVKTVEFPAPERALVAVIAGMAGRQAGSREDPRLLRADLYRFDLEFSEEAPGTWRVTNARWQPASLDEVL